MRRGQAWERAVDAPDLVEQGPTGQGSAGGTRACGPRRARTLHAGCLSLAVLVAATGCFPAPATDVRRGYRIWLVPHGERDSRPRPRYTVVGRGAPTLYAGPVSPGAGQATPRSLRGRGTCTAVTIWLPGIIVFDGDRGSVIGTVDTNLTPGGYTIRANPKAPGVLIEPWHNANVVLTVALDEDSPPATGVIFESYLANMTKRVPLRVIAASAAAATTPAGAPCQACTRLERLAAPEAQVLLDALSQRIPPGERAIWLRWVTDLEARAAGLPGRDSLRE